MNDAMNERPKLGELLVERGLLSQERLESALAEQAATGLPLGTILVREGLVPTHAVALALADQTGSPRKTEHGFAMPHTPDTAPVVPLRPPPTSGGMPPPVSSSPPPPPPAPPSVAVTLPPAPPPAPAPPAPDLAALDERFAALEARADELAAGLAETRGDLDRERAASLELRERIAELELQVTAYRAELAPPPPAARVYSAERHVLLLPGSEGYELLERRGPAPAAGATVLLSGPREYRVVRVGPAPFPGALEACAFLEAVPTADDGA